MTGTRISRTMARLYATLRRRDTPRAKTVRGFRTLQVMSRTPTGPTPGRRTGIPVAWLAASYRKTAAARSFNSSFAPFGVTYILSNQVEHQLYIGRTFSCHAARSRLQPTRRPHALGNFRAA